MKGKDAFTSDHQRDNRNSFHHINQLTTPDILHRKNMYYVHPTTKNDSMFQCPQYSVIH